MKKMGRQSAQLRTPTDHDDRYTVVRVPAAYQRCQMWGSTAKPRPQVIDRFRNQEKPRSKSNSSGRARCTVLNTPIGPPSSTNTQPRAANITSANNAPWTRSVQATPRMPETRV